MKYTYSTPDRAVHLSVTTLFSLTIPPLVPYAWDEPTSPELLCLQVKGVSEEKQFDLNLFTDQGKVYYESYFHIVAAPTSERGCLKGREEYVLDVPQGKAVILTNKVSYMYMYVIVLMVFIP